MDNLFNSFQISVSSRNMMFNDFSNGLSETRDAIANGYFWDSEAVETRLNQ